MSFIGRLRNWLYDSRVRHLDVDDEGLLELHAAILAEKPMLRSAFNSFYDTMLECNERFLSGEGTEIELGSGAGFFKDRRPRVVTSDVRHGAHIDRTLDAQDMDVPDNLEPHNGLASAALHRLLHKDERFEPNEANWRNSHIAGPLSGANQALAHIVFSRDRSIFNACYGDNLSLVHKGYVLNGIRYLLSGGLNFRQLAPSIAIPVLRAIEGFMFPIAKFWTLHQVIVIKKSPISRNPG
jgi:hypothetical protein